MKIRLQRTRISKSVWNIIKAKLLILQKVPFIELVAITGSLAVLNSDHHSDIDFYIITKPNRVWLSRLMLYMVEKHIEKNSPGNIHLCFNFINSTSMIKQVHENIYVAREIMQMKLLTGDPVYYDFIRKNPWITEYLPNVDLKNYSNKINKMRTVPLEQSLVTRTINRIISRLNQSDKGIINYIVGMLDYLEYQRASAKIFKNFKLSPETNFSRNEYKAHFGMHQKRVIKIMNK